MVNEDSHISTTMTKAEYMNSGLYDRSFLYINLYSPFNVVETTTKSKYLGINIMLFNLG